MNETPPGNGVRVYTVGEFSANMHKVFARVRAFDYLGVSGEVSEFSVRPFGVYFTIKDANAVLQCFAHPSRARKFPKMELGTAVIVFGAVRVAERRSRYEIEVSEVQLTGIGKLFQEYEALKEQFRALGFFERARKRPVPAFPRSVALVSARGKGAEDFQTTLGARAPQVRVDFIETRVQGIGADVEIADALDRAGRTGADIIVLARGGGSYEDLFAFNREPVVRAIVRSKLPVITGIGHTGDHHLADDVADLSCETPSNAAQHIAQLWQRGGDRLSRLRAQLDREMRDRFARALQRGDAALEALSRAWERGLAKRRERLGVLERKLLAQNPSNRIQRRVTQLAVGRERLARAHERYFSQRTRAVEVMQSRLDLNDPLKPLERGYAIVSKDGRAMRDARETVPGDAIEARLFLGSLVARVEKVTEDA